MGHDFITFIVDENNLFWQRNDDGEIVLLPSAKPLLFSPDGIFDNVIKNARNKQYFNIDRQASLPLKYVEDGAEILMHIFTVKGTEKKTFLLIGELTLEYNPGVDYGYWYKQILRNEIDISTVEQDGPFVTANTLEEGLAKHLRANEKTVYPIPLNVPEAINVRQDGVKLIMTQNYSTVGQDFVFDQDTYPTEIALPLYKVSSEGVAPYIVFNDEQLESFHVDNSTFKYAVQSKNYFAFDIPTSPTPIQISFSKTLTIEITAQRTVRQFKLYLWHVPATATPTTPGIRIEVWNTGLMNVNVPKTFDFATIAPRTLNAGDRLFFMLDRNPGASTSDMSDYRINSGSGLSISFGSRYQTTFCKAHRPKYIADMLLRKMSDNEFSLDDCPYLDLHFNKVFTSGDGIREIENAELKISWEMFWSFWDTYDAVALKENIKKVLFDRKKAILDATKVKTINIAYRPKISFDKDLPFNTLYMGYENIENEQGFVNGKNEFNTTSVWSLGSVNNPKELKKISMVQASCYAQEQLRIQNILQDTTDNRSDNKPFVIHVENVETDGAYNYDRSLNPFVTGIDDIDTVFNVGLSPKRCLINNGDWLRSCLYLADDKILKFISADRNSKMVYINGADIIIENADVHINELADKFLKPVLMTIETSDVDNPLDYFEFEIDGYIYRGISIENSVNPKTEAKQTYILWSDAVNDLSRLIKYHG